MTPISELFDFIDVAVKKNFFNENTIQSRRTACNKFVEILDEDQKTVEYLAENLDIVKARFTNRYTDIRGNTVDLYANRVQLVVKDFLAWKADRSAWEREVATRQSGRTTGTEAEKRTRAEKPKPTPAASAPPRAEDAETQTVRIPLPGGREAVMTLPRELTVKDLQRVLWALLPYASDWDPSASTPRQVFPQIDGRSDLSA